MSYSISGIQGAWSHTFGFPGAITPGNPNIYLTRPASSGSKADCRAVRGFPLAAAGYSTTLRACGTPQSQVISRRPQSRHNRQHWRVIWWLAVRARWGHGAAVTAVMSVAFGTGGIQR